jgi:hypothetical protein
MKLTKRLREHFVLIYQKAHVAGVSGVAIAEESSSGTLGQFSNCCQFVHNQ